jgi:hypothetical protein
MRLIDGHRRVAQIAVMMPGRDLETELAELMASHLVLAPGTPSAPPQAAPAVLPARWSEAVDFMRTVAVASLGVMAQPVIKLLEQVRDTASARHAVARWHMALRESRAAREEADAHLHTVTHMLGL